MTMSPESASKPVDTVEDKPEEKLEQKVEAKLERKVEEERPAKPMEEPPPELPFAPNPEVAVEPPPRQEVKQQTPLRQEPAAPAPTTTAPSVVPEQTAALPAAPPQSTTIKSSQGVMRWKNLVSAAIERNKRYPEQSRVRREQGVAQVVFSLDRQGRVIASRIVHSSGAAALDEEALALLRRAQPFPPPPREDFSGEQVDLTVPIRFNLK
jgi:protein TonB